MKATIDIPDELYRRVKARAALDGRAVREIAIELFTEWVGLREPVGEAPDAARRPLTGAEWLARWEELGAETARRGIDPRTTREILEANRR
jgi:hypothetical protein